MINGPRVFYAKLSTFNGPTRRFVRRIDYLETDPRVFVAESERQTDPLQFCTESVLKIDARVFYAKKPIT
jgi:hypothetical protein